MMNKTHTFSSKRGYNLVCNKVIQTEGTHCDIINAYIIKVRETKKASQRCFETGLSRVSVPG